jgi:hypothetical protein
MDSLSFLRPEMGGFQIDLGVGGGGLTEELHCSRYLCTGVDCAINWDVRVGVQVLTTDCYEMEILPKKGTG